jgi:hypothetical protein
VEATLDGAAPGFFFELSPRDLERSFAGFDQALRNGPDPLILASEEWTARMDDEELPFRSSPVHQETGAALGFHSISLFATAASNEH